MLPNDTGVLPCAVPRILKTYGKERKEGRKGCTETNIKKGGGEVKCDPCGKTFVISRGPQKTDRENFTNESRRVTKNALIIGENATWGKDTR